jgi:hypothetical protein
MKRFNTFTVAVASLVFASTVISGGVAGAATLNVVGGILYGASGVDVGGTLYDVEFVDGTCIDLFNGCDELSDFTFKTEAAAALASLALVDQVFRDVALGDFDSDPLLTNGCEVPANGGSLCIVDTPYIFFASDDVTSPAYGIYDIGDHVGIWYAVNDHFAYPVHQPQPTLSEYIDVNRDLYLTSTETYAVWSSIPEPNTALLLGIGLIGMSLRRRDSSKTL